MDKKLTDIIQLVDKIFQEEFSPTCDETVLGLESRIDGKEEFLKNLTTGIELLLNNVKECDIEEVCDKCYDEVDVNYNYVSTVFQWLIDHDYQIVKVINK